MVAGNVLVVYGIVNELLHVVPSGDTSKLAGAVTVMLSGGAASIIPLVEKVSGVELVPAVVAANESDVGVRYNVGGMGTMFT